MDPYVIFNSEFKTPVHSKGGENPIWKHTFEIPVKSYKETLKYSAYDDDMGNDDLIGEGTCSVRDVCGGEERAIPIEYKGKKAGEIIVEGKIVSQAEY
jgi:Ca2+-dependent lipid-binding protein